MQAENEAARNEARKRPIDLAAERSQPPLGLRHRQAARPGKNLPTVV
jgi:hypothetical protein